MKVSYCLQRKKTKCSLSDSRFLWMLPEIPQLEGHLPVCVGCLKPRFLVYEKLLKLCDNCFNRCALPWENECSECFYENNEEGACYSGLWAARALSLRAYPRGLRGANMDVVVTLCENLGYRRWAELLTESVNLKLRSETA